MVARSLRRVIVFAAVLVALAVVASPASAGGAVWHFAREGYQPGEIAISVTAIAWEHNEQLGTPEDGPFYAYLVGLEKLRELTSAETGSWPSIPDGAVRVAQIDVGLGPVEEYPGFFVGPHHARIQFRVPDLPDGNYQVLHCNDPCTTSLADITGGSLIIGPAPPVTPPTTLAPVAPTRPVASTSEPHASATLPLPVVVAAACSALAAAFWTVMRLPRRWSCRSSS